MASTEDSVEATQHLTRDELEAGIEAIRESPKNPGVLEMIVRRPEEDGREVLEEGELDVTVGLVGDTWGERFSKRTEDGSPHPDMQLNLMNSRAAELITQGKDRWSLAGDQLFVDFDLSEENVPAGTRLSIGDALIEVTSQPHTGCQKFAARFGKDALKFVNSKLGGELHLRGINAKVIEPGRIKVGDAVKKA